jgi:hypothetical protein
MAGMAGTRSGEDPRRIGHTSMGPSREDARQGGPSRTGAGRRARLGDAPAAHPEYDAGRRRGERIERWR